MKFTTLTLLCPVYYCGADSTCAVLGYDLCVVFFRVSAVCEGVSGDAGGVRLRNLVSLFTSADLIISITGYIFHFK